LRRRIINSPEISSDELKKIYYINQEEYEEPNLEQESFDELMNKNDTR